jgi:predicted dehydrogenase
LSSDEKVSIGVFGTGYLGRLHARVLSQMPEVDVAGFFDPDDAAAAEVETQLGLKRIGSIDELIELVECGVVASPTTSHADVATRLLERGRDVMIEKPITAEPDDARRLIRLAAERERIIQVGHVERYNPAIQAIASLVERPRFIEAERLGVFVGRSLDVDVLLDLMIHDLNLVLSLTGRSITEVSAVGVPVLTDKVDIANVRLELDDATVANLTASRVSSDRVRKFRIFGSDIYVSVDTREQEVKGYRLVHGAKGRAIEPIEVSFDRKEPLRAELESFVDCVRTRRSPLVTAEDGLAALELAIRVGAEIDASLQRAAEADRRR